MLKRFKIGTGAVLGLAALAMGGSAVASATSSTPAKKASLVSTSAPEPKATGRDTDNVQSGDQTTPDSATASKASKASESNTSESSSESSTSESSTPSDGPGGHADAPGNVDNQSGNQSGNQTTPDSAKASKASKASKAGESNTSESSSESSTSESSAPSDGPGGHADPTGNVDNQQQGQN